MKSLIIIICLLTNISLSIASPIPVWYNNLNSPYFKEKPIIKNYSIKLKFNNGNPIIPCPGSGNGFWAWLQDKGSDIGRAVGNFLGGVSDFFNSLGGGEGFGAEGSDTWVFDDTQIIAYNDTGSFDPNTENYDSNTRDFYNNAGGYWNSYNSYDPNNPFADCNNPINSPDDPVIDNGFQVIDVPNPCSSTSSTVIAKTISRNNTEDLKSETNADGSGIFPYLQMESDYNLFTEMDQLIASFTFFDDQLHQVGKSMIDKFKQKTGGKFQDPILNSKVSSSATLINFIKKVGNDIDIAMKNAGGNINNVPTIQLSYRPIFNGLYNKFNGLQILINDTEYTEISLCSFYTDGSGNYHCIVNCTINDHFGLDKNDALTYQVYSAGFPAWWILQHQRGYVPFITQINVTKEIVWHP